jgi:EAL domain-containing protein (putative c-di-GMP-specific phosphodiesterase class I)
MKNMENDQIAHGAKARPRSRMALVFSIVLILVCILGFFNLRSALIESKEQLAASFAQHILTALMRNDEQQVAQLMKSLEGVPGVQMAELVANNGQTLASYSRTGQPVDYAQQAQFELATHLDDNKLHIMVPVSFDTQIIANLYLSIDLWASCAPYFVWLGSALFAFAALYLLIKQRHVKIRIEKITQPPSSGGGGGAGATFDVDNAMRQALDEADIMLKYLPIMRLADNGLFGVEVLVSWLHPSGQRLNISPADFIALAEQSGMFLPFGSWVMTTACQQAAVWHHQYGPLALSLNLSASQLQSATLVDQIHAACVAAQFPHQFIEFEVNESLLLRQPELMKQAVENFVDKGMSLTLDRFGSTHQSVALLQSLPIRKIKLDHKILDVASEDLELSSTLQMMTAFAIAMNVNVMVDGVNSAEQRQSLHVMGCVLGQGTYCGAAMSANEFADFLACRSRIGPVPMPFVSEEISESPVSRFVPKSPITA